MNLSNLASARQVCRLIFLVMSGALLAFTSPTNEMDSLQKVLEGESNPKKQIDVILSLAEKSQETDLKKSFSYVQRAEEISKKLNVDSITLKVKIRLAAIYFQQGELNKALTNYHYCFKYAHKIKDSNLILLSTANIGAVYQVMGDYKNAQHYYLQTKKILEQNKSKYSNNSYSNRLIAVYNNLGNNSNTMGDSVNGLLYYKQAMKLSIEIKDIYSYGLINRNIGEYYLNHNKPDSAYSYLKESYSSLKKANNLVTLSSTYYSLGKYYAMKKNFQMAVAMYSQSIAQAITSGAKGSEMEVNYELYKLYKDMNNYKLALAYLENYKDLSDSLNNSSHIREMLKIQHNVENEKREFEQQERKKRTEVYFALGVVSIIVLIVVFMLIIRLYKTRYTLLMIENKANELEKSKLDNEIESKNKELATNVLYLTQKNAMVSESIEVLKDILPEMTKSQKHALRQVIQNLENSTKTGNWEEFELLFQQINTAFYDALTANFPDLTLNERRLCAFIRLNLSNKDIMAITGQSLRALEMGRHRLRKKLNIQDSTVSLSQFLAELENNATAPVPVE